MSFEILNVEKVYCAAAAEVASVTTKWENVVFDLSQDGELKSAVDAMHEIRSVRTSIEKTRVMVKEPYIKAGRDIDAYAKELSNKVMAVEAAVSEQIQRHKDEIARIENEQRLKAEQEQAAILRKIRDIDDIPRKVGDKSAAAVSSAMQALQELTLDNFGDFLKQAEEARERALEVLRMLLDAKRAAEASAAVAASRVQDSLQAAAMPTTPMVIEETKTEQPKAEPVKPVAKVPTKPEVVALVASAYGVDTKKAEGWLAKMSFKSEEGKK